MTRTRRLVPTLSVLAGVALVAALGCQPVYRLPDGQAIRELRDDQVADPLVRAKLELAELAAQKTRTTNAAIAARKIQSATAPSASATTAWLEAQRQGRRVTEALNRAEGRLQAGDLAGYRREVDLFGFLIAGLEDYAVNAAALEPEPAPRGEPERPRFDPRDIPAPPADAFEGPYP